MAKGYEEEESNPTNHPVSWMLLIRTECRHYQQKNTETLLKTVESPQSYEVILSSVKADYWRFQWKSDECSYKCCSSFPSWFAVGLLLECKGDVKRVQLVLFTLRFEIFRIRNQPPTKSGSNHSLSLEDKAHFMSTVISAKEIYSNFSDLFTVAALLEEN